MTRTAREYRFADGPFMYGFEGRSWEGAKETCGVNRLVKIDGVNFFQRIADPKPLTVAEGAAFFCGRGVRLLYDAIVALSAIVKRCINVLAQIARQLAVRLKALPSPTKTA